MDYQSTKAIPLSEQVEFADNPEPRCPCVLVLDTSSSMNGAPLMALQNGLNAFRNALVTDVLARRRVEVAIISFNNEISLTQAFTTPDKMDIPELKAFGSTQMAPAISLALDIVTNRKLQYRRNGVSYYRPWVFLITDGSPDEGITSLKEVATRIKASEKEKHLAFFAVGVGSADMSCLSYLSTRTPLTLQGLKFEELFSWLSASMQRVSQSRTDEQVTLPPVGWASI